MRIFCWFCHKSVSTELPEETVFRAIAVCPECIEKQEDFVLKEGNETDKELLSDSHDK